MIGESKLKRALRKATATGEEVKIPFRRGGCSCYVILEPFENVVGVGVQIKVPNCEVEDTNYQDFDIIREVDILAMSILAELPFLYRQSEIGVHLKLGVWENPLPPKLTLEELAYYLDIPSDSLQEIPFEFMNYGKIKLFLTGTFYGERWITVAQSGKTEYITHVLSVE